jgi:hypothetical protein
MKESSGKISKTKYEVLKPQTSETWENIVNMVQNKHQDLAKFRVKLDQNSELELSFFINSRVFLILKVS